MKSTAIPMIGLVATIVMGANGPPLRCYTPKEGLSHTTVHSMHQDRHGYLWFGAYEAVNRFDGVSFTNPLADWDIPVSRVRRIVGTEDGAIWLATHGGAIRIVEGAPPLTLGVAEGLADSSVFDIAPGDDGVLWFGTARGLTSMTPDGRFHTVVRGLPDKRVRRVLPARGGGFWLGTLGGLAFFDGEAVADFEQDPLLGTAAIYDLLTDRAGRLWMGTDNGLLCIDQDGVARRFDERDGLPDRNVWALCEDTVGTLWIGADAGVGYLDAANWDERFPPQFQKISRELDLGNTTIYSIDLDREGNLWFSTCIGVYQLVDRAVANLTPSPGKLAFAIFEDSGGSHWFGTELGVSRLGVDGELRPVDLPLPDPFVRAIAETEDGALWFGSRKGALSWKGGRARVYDGSDGMPDEHVMSMLATPDGSLYLGFLKGGMARYDGRRFHVWSADDGLAADRVYALTRDGQGRIWAATEGGVSVIDGERISSYRDELPGLEVYDALQDRKGVMWFAASEGLASLDRGVFTVYGERDGLPAGACQFVTEDADGRIWVGTARGVSRFDGNGFKTWSTASGLAHNEMNIGAAICDRRGVLWFGHYAGVSRLDPRLVVINRTPPPTRIVGMRVWGEPVPIDRPVSLRRHRNRVALSFIGLSYRAQEQLRFHYKLEGHDLDWLETGARQAAYADLQPGRYTFRVKARNRDGVWSEKPAQLSFVILPPWWRQWPFRAAVFGALALAAMWQVQRLRSRNAALAREARLLSARVEKETAEKLRREAEIKLLHAQMNPHFLQNAFTNAIYFVKSSPDKAERVLRKLATLFRGSMNAKRHVLSTVAEERQMIEDYLEIQKIRFEDRLTYDISDSSSLADRPLPSFALQPLVENAVIHGFRENLGPLRVRVTFTPLENGGVAVAVANNGQALDQPFERLLRDGHALANINKRLRLLGLDALRYRHAAGDHVFSFETKGGLELENAAG